jgi:hypothetical protein
MRITRTPLVVYHLKSRYPKINPKPAYQRGEVWSLSKKQLLIDTILQKLDIPKIYLRTIKLGDFEYEVLDGQQRIRAIWQYLNDEYSLGEISDLIDGYNASGKKYSELPTAVQEKITAYPLDIVEIEDASDDEISDLFLRLNNGETLRAAEKRNAIPGAMTAFVRKLAQHKFFEKSCAFKNIRFTYDDIAARIVLLELSGGPHDVNASDLNEMYKKEAGFDQNGAEAKRVGQALNFLTSAFPSKNPVLKKSVIPCLFLVADELLRAYAVDKMEAAFGNWFVEFDKKVRAELDKETEEKNQDLVDYDLNNQQGSGKKRSLQTRYEILMNDFLTSHPKLRLRDNERIFNEDQRRAIFLKDKGICRACGQQCEWNDFHTDHIEPHSKGGKTVLANGQVLCGKCNWKKGKKSAVKPALV